MELCRNTLTPRAPGQFRALVLISRLLFTAYRSEAALQCASTVSEDSVCDMHASLHSVHVSSFHPFTCRPSPGAGSQTGALQVTLLFLVLSHSDEVGAAPGQHVY